VFAACPALVAAEVHQHAGSGEALPADKYVRVVGEVDSSRISLYGVSLGGNLRERSTPWSSRSPS
jgi:hypothetical protein